ncbi:MAG TPA: chromosomal replication initiator protein DnaA [Rhodothermales bacterium]|nr:chromosomal replication initiator protein DnaA [Rhodothermales bacterium]
MMSPAQSVWERCLDSVAREVSPQAFKTWFVPLKPVSLDRNDHGTDVELRLELPSQFYHEWLAQHYGPLLDSVVAQAVGHPTHITFSVSARPVRDGVDPTVTDRPAAERPSRTQPTAERTRGRERPLASAVTRQQTPPRARTSASADFRAPAGINPKYTFDCFIEGDCNRLARSASQAISERPGETSFNPFLIYGGVGLGKTHLVQAIANYAQNKGTAQRMRYVSSEQFTSEFVQAIQSNRIQAFTSYYRQMDLLIVDDVQFFGGKEKTQEEFFHIFNDLHQRGKQVVLCADRPPRDISGIEERLLSRFQWGLTADVQMPELETRIAILNHKAESEGSEVPPEVIAFVAERVTSNVRELEGSLIRLLAHARLHRRDVTLELAAEALRGLLRDEPARLDIADIQRMVADFCGMDVKLLLGASRKREIVNARHLAIYLCKHYTQHTLKTIGTHFGGRDHSTIIHACGAIEDRLDTDPDFSAEFNQIQRKLKGHQPPSRNG